MKHISTKQKNLLGKLLLTIVAVLLTTQAYSQQLELKPLPELETDRPDQTESASIVPVRFIQLETGLYFQKSKNGNTEQTYLAYPTALLRMGILNWLEFRMEGTYQRFKVQDEIDTRISGFGPLTVGAKAKLWNEDGLLPQTAFMTMVDLPVGHPEFKPSDPQANFRMMFKNTLSENTDLNYNLAYGWEDGNAVKGYSVSVGTGLSDKVGLFGEVFGDKTKGEKAVHSADIGMIFLVLPNLQFDLATGTVLNSSKPDFFVTTGFSVRLPR